MKEIRLFGGQLAKVDDDDYEWLSRVPWSIDNYGYAQNGLKRVKIRMHQAVMGKPPEGKEIHHKDADRLNNQKSNLEFISYSAHQHLSRRKKSRLGYWGVHQHGARFKAKIMHNYKTLHLGVFDDPESAARAYDKKASELFGSLARLNFPKE